mgnify:CR=1 FL=1
MYFMEMNTRLPGGAPGHRDGDRHRSRRGAARDRGRRAARRASARRSLSSGHAIEFRINAEDPDRGFRPDPGSVTAVVAATRHASGACVRWDAGVAAGWRVPPHYDSMIGKVIVHAADAAPRRSRPRRKRSTSMRVDGDQDDDSACTSGSSTIRGFARGDVRRRAPRQERARRPAAVGSAEAAMAKVLLDPIGSPRRARRRRKRPGARSARTSRRLNGGAPAEARRGARRLGPEVRSPRAQEGKAPDVGAHRAPEGRRQPGAPDRNARQLRTDLRRRQEDLSGRRRRDGVHPRREAAGSSSSPTTTRWRPGSLVAADAGEDRARAGDRAAAAASRRLPRRLLGPVPPGAGAHVSRPHRRRARSSR